MSILVALIVVALVQVGIGAVQFRSGNNFMLIPFLQRFDYGRRASGFYVCPNHFAGLLEVIGIFCVSLVCWSRWPLWAKLLVGYAGLVCYVGLALTGSRGGYLGASVSLCNGRNSEPPGFAKVGRQSSSGESRVEAVCSLFSSSRWCSSDSSKAIICRGRVQNVVDPHEHSSRSLGSGDRAVETATRDRYRQRNLFVLWTALSHSTNAVGSGRSA